MRATRSSSSIPLPTWPSPTSSSRRTSSRPSRDCNAPRRDGTARSEEHTSELQSQSNLVCRLLLEKKKRWRAAGTLLRIRAALRPGDHPGPLALQRENRARPRVVREPLVADRQGLAEADPFFRQEDRDGLLAGVELIGGPLRRQRHDPDGPEQPPPARDVHVLRHEARLRHEPEEAHHGEDRAEHA